MAEPSSDTYDDVANKVIADLDEWLQEAATVFQKGSLTRVADKVWNSQPEEVKAAARQEIPEAAKQLDSIRKKGK